MQSLMLIPLTLACCLAMAVPIALTRRKNWFAVAGAWHDVVIAQMECDMANHTEHLNPYLQAGRRGVKICPLLKSHWFMWWRVVGEYEKPLPSPLRIPGENRPAPIHLRPYR